MLKFTYGPPDDLQVWIACGIATYLIVFPLVILAAVVCGGVMRRLGSDEAAAAPAPGERPALDPAGRQTVFTPVSSLQESGAGTAA